MLSNLLYFIKQPQSRVIGLIFFSMSFLFGSWVSRIPEVQNKLALSDSGLGWAILAMSAGAFIITPLAGELFTKMDIPKAIFLGIGTMMLALLSIILVPSFLLLCITLFVFGMSQSFLNIAINTSVTSVEKSSGRKIMSTCHSMYSIGAMIGAGIGSFLVGSKIPGVWHFIGVIVFILLLILISIGRLKTLPNAKVKSNGFSWPPRVLWALTFICFCGMLGEGVVAAWSGIFLEKTLKANAYLLGLGFAGFSASMAVGRLLGDSLTMKLGIQKLLWISLLVGAIGLGISVSTSVPWIGILGFIISGLGLSIVVPVVFSAAAEVKGVAPSQGIAAVAGIGILGFLAGPPIIGFIADFTSMRFGLMITAATLLFAFGITFIKKERRARG